MSPTLKLFGSPILFGNNNHSNWVTTAVFPPLLQHLNLLLADGFILFWQKNDNMVALGERIITTHDKERFKVNFK